MLAPFHFTPAAAITTTRFHDQTQAFHILRIYNVKGETVVPLTEDRKFEVEQGDEANA